MIFATVEASAIISVLTVVLGGGFITALIAIYKARPERDSVVVTTTQNAATILKGLNEALYADLTRARSERDLAEAERNLFENALREAGIPVPQLPPSQSVPTQNSKG